MQNRKGLHKRTAESLAGLGFRAIGATSFARGVGEQLHFVGLQYGGSSRGFTYNLACHFRGLPSLFDFKPMSLNELDDLNCGLRARVGQFIRDGLDLWWDANSSELHAAIAEATWAIDRAFAKCIERWDDGRGLLDREVKTRSKTVRLSEYILTWCVNGHSFDAYAFLALLAHRHDMLDLAKLLHRKALGYRHDPDDDPLLAAALRRGSRGQKRWGQKRCQEP